MKECTFDSEVSVESSNDQSVKHLDSVSGKLYLKKYKTEF